MSTSGNSLLAGGISGEVTRTLRTVLLTLLIVVPLLLAVEALDVDSSPSEMIALAVLMAGIVVLYVLLLAGHTSLVFSGVVLLLIVYACAGAAA